MAVGLPTGSTSASEVLGPVMVHEALRRAALRRDSPWMFGSSAMWIRSTSIRPSKGWMPNHDGGHRVQGLHDSGNHGQCRRPALPKEALGTGLGRTPVRSGFFQCGGRRRNGHFRKLRVRLWSGSGAFLLWGPVGLAIALGSGSETFRASLRAGQWTGISRRPGLTKTFPCIWP